MPPTLARSRREPAGGRLRLGPDAVLVEGGRVAERDSSGGGVPDGSSPQGGVYEWYQRGLHLLGNGDPAAAAVLLGRAAEAEPGSRSVREALARAQYDAGWYREAMDSFTELIAVNPTDDYAQFGLGLAASRAGELRLAAEHLALAVAMRPDLGHYTRALRGVRARRAAESA